MRDKIRINQGRVMNGMFRYVATLAVFAVSVIITAKLNSIVGFIIILVLAFVLIMVWTSLYLVEIDLEKKEYGDYTVVLGRKFGELKSYPEIEDVFIKKFNTSQNVQNYGTGRTYNLRDVEYQAYLKFTDDVKVELVSDKNEDRLIKRLEPIVKKMRTTIRRS